MNEHWFLGNRKNKEVFKNLYSNQVAQKVVEAYGNNYAEQDWVVWSQGWDKWKSLTEVDELLSEVHSLKKMQIEAIKALKKKGGLVPESAPPPIEDHMILPEDALVKAATPHAASSDQDRWANRRNYKRVGIRLRCIIRNENHTFRTFTSDVSLGGVAVEGAVPADLLGTECKIYITAPNMKQNLRFKIKLASRPGLRFFTFESADPGFLKQLQQWLDSYLESQAA